MSSYFTPASVSNPLKTASTISPSIIFITNVVGKGIAASGLFLSYQSWQVGLPTFDIRNVKSFLVLPSPNWRLSASDISETILLMVVSDIDDLPFTASSMYLCNASSAGCFIMLLPLLFQCLLDRQSLLNRHLPLKSLLSLPMH